MKFKVGDIIKGTHKGDLKYNATNHQMSEGLVVEIDTDGGDKIKIKILKHDYPYEVGKTYWAWDVTDEDFEVIRGGESMKELSWIVVYLEEGEIYYHKCESKEEVEEYIEKNLVSNPHIRDVKDDVYIIHGDIICHARTTSTVELEEEN